jgi:diguanylate cyclase (GGDEF)-like protein
MVSLLWVLGTFVGILLLPLAPLGEPIEPAGWLAIAAMAVAAFVTCGYLLSPDRHVGFDQLLALSYVALVLLVVAQWLTGGAESPLRELYLLAALSGVGVHPPRRALVFLVTIEVAIAAPLLYGGWSTTAAAEILARGLLWCSLSLVVIALMANVRNQRVGMSAKERQAQALARVDALTGLGNRRAFEEALQGEVAREQRAGSSATLLLLDVDRFKQINDEHGHRSGDRCLRELAAALNGTLRPTDRCYRWGGDEFVVLLPATERSEAERIGERIAAAVGETCSRPGGGRLRVSCGLAEISDADEADALIEAADLALFRQKRLAVD